MIKPLYFIISVFLLSTNIYSQKVDNLALVPPNEALKIKASLVACIEKYFDGIEGLQYQASQSYTAANLPTKDNPDRLTTIEYRGQAPFYDFKMKQVDGNGKILNTIKEVAYDGNYAQTLYEDGTLNLYKVKPGFDDSSLCTTLGGKTALFAPFWFINPEVIRNPYYVDQIWNYAKLIDSNKSFVDLAILGRQVVDGTSCILIALKTGNEYKNDQMPGMPTFPSDTEIRVNLNEEAGYYPIKWQLVSKTRGTVLEYQVEKLGSFKDVSGINRHFPVKASLTDYGSLKKVNLTKPSIITYEVKSVIILSSRGANSDFTIDPGLAHFIFDEDKHVGISVPK